MAAPLSGSISAHASAVAPVVMTSSARRMLFPRITAGRSTRNASRTFLWRSSRSVPTCVSVGRTLKSTSVLIRMWDMSVRNIPATDFQFRSGRYAWLNPRFRNRLM